MTQNSEFIFVPLSVGSCFVKLESGHATTTTMTVLPV